MGIPLTHPAIQQALERGLIRAEDLAGDPTATTPVEPPSEEPADDARPELVAPSFTPPGTWTLPIATASEANLRSWRARSSRTQAARRAISAAFGARSAWVAAFAAHYHSGGSLRVALTRLGGRRLDASNLPTAMKAVEDAVALLLGADDGDPRWHAEWHAEPVGPVGVRVDLGAV